MPKLSFCSIIVLLFILEACTKTTNNPSVNNNTAPIWPMKAGNSWVYRDSIFNANGEITISYTDSTFISDKTISNNGNTFFAYNDSLGWFGASSYIAVDGSNNSLYLLDSLNASSSYLFFSMVLPDPSDTDYDAWYSFTNTFNINGFTCYKNLEQVKDDDGTIIYANVYYVSPGIGVVRIEEYIPDPNTKALYLDYSQTLQSYNLK